MVPDISFRLRVLCCPVFDMTMLCREHVYYEIDNLKIMEHLPWSSQQLSVQQQFSNRPTLPKKAKEKAGEWPRKPRDHPRQGCQRHMEFYLAVLLLGGIKSKINSILEAFTESNSSAKHPQHGC